MMSHVIRATGIGSWPGTGAREAIVTVRDLLLGDAGSGEAAVGLPYLPETPARGPGADLVGRGAGILTDLPVQLEPSGWRLASRPGRDSRRTAALWHEDLDELAEAYAGYAGPIKIAVAGPWTLAASIELPRGERALSDVGAALEIAASLGDGIARLLGDLARVLPAVRPVLQLDEPSLPAVLTGAVPTASGLGRIRPADVQEVLRGLHAVTEVAAGETLIHCCDPAAPLPVLRAAGATGLSIDLTAASPARWESVAAGLEAGLTLYAGVLPTDGTGAVTEIARGVLAQAERVGIASDLLAGIVVSPACGLAGAGREAAIAVQRSVVHVAEELNAALDAS